MNIKPLAITILVHLSRSSGKEFYVREVARETGASLGGCHKALRELLVLGLVKSRKSGRNLYYTVDAANPAIPRFKIFINLVELKKLVDCLRPSVFKAVLFGSCASGADTQDSDIDIFIITPEPGPVREILKSMKLSRKIQAVIFTPGQLLESREKDPAFHGEIDKGIVLYRAEDERF
ncbi:MAG: nucleotidyltransferase domain-containing protein [Candidatus Thermoplasmatota archaeon]|nr:nucleotidyltransferase domain-containing protein [Candidatus Thermoplasmatota archaeon]MBU4072327.1 nucleotidyltransferase domain-containing protein [Candidatus Thermoplasmatota archaeon]MBU4143353.1 nucleotidyltransferase domain-containing protein [Candidatus Thermoplasmatota archaeon]MBU4591179.1 nucleotidyltransferase domain-containing protein [Candidatus Thermoplasmatota archaeon]